MSIKTIQLKAIAELAAQDITALEWLHGLEEMSDLLAEHIVDARKEWQDGIDRTVAAADKVLVERCPHCGCKLGVLVGELVKHADTCPNLPL